MDTSGNDIPGLSATINLSSTSFPAGQMAAVSTLTGYNPTGVSLQANTTYYIVSQEVAGYDYWYDYAACPVRMLMPGGSVGSFVGAAWADASAPTTYTTVQTPYTYGPVAMWYDRGGTATRVDSQTTQINAVLDDEGKSLSIIDINEFPDLW